MANKARNTSGKFAPKSETPRKIRSVNLTDEAWQWLADVAAQSGVSRNDYLEAMAEGNIPFMETVSSEVLPIIETAQSEDAEITEQPDTNTLPLMETVEAELESLKQELEDVQADRVKLLESSSVVTNKLEREVRELRSQLATERADREELEAELAELKQNSAPASDATSQAAAILNWLRKTVKALPKEVTLSNIKKALEE